MFTHSLAHKQGRGDALLNYENEVIFTNRQYPPAERLPYVVPDHNIRVRALQLQPADAAAQLLFTDACVRNVLTDACLQRAHRCMHACTLLTDACVQLAHRCMRAACSCMSTPLPQCPLRMLLLALASMMHPPHPSDSLLGAAP